MAIIIWCFESSCRGALLRRPPTRRRPFTKIGSNFASTLDFFTPSPFSMALLSSAKVRLWSNMITSLSASFISEQDKGSKLADWELVSKLSCVDFRFLVMNLLWHRRQTAMNFNNLSQDENRWTKDITLD